MKVVGVTHFTIQFKSYASYDKRVGYMVLFNHSESAFHSEFVNYFVDSAKVALPDESFEGYLTVQVA